MRPSLAPFALACSLVVAFGLAPPLAAHAQGNVRLPALGEAEADQFSILDEKKLGEQIMRQVRPDPDVVDDPVLNGYVDSVFRPLYEAARREGNISPDMDAAYGWETFLVNDRTFNAFALPGGYIGIHLGLIAAAGTRDEMASVLGHELSHITQRHIARSMVANSHQSMLATAAMLLGMIAAAHSKNSDVGQAVLVSGQAAMATGQLTFSRQMESEADRFGLNVMTDAGFAPSGMAAMFERLDQASRLNDDNSYPWLRSHPLTIDRLAEARLRAKDVPVPDPETDHLAEHQLMRARARVLMDTSDPALHRLQVAARQGAPKDDLVRLGDLYGGALASVHLGDYDSARQMLDAARQLMAEHATRVAEWMKAHPGGAAAPRASMPASVPDLQHVVVEPRPWPLEPEVARDFALLRVEYAVGKRAPAEIQAAVAALGSSRSREVVMTRAQGAVGLATTRDPSARAALQRETEDLQTWLSDHPKDATAWDLLAQTAEPLGLKLRAIRAEAEAHAARGDLRGAIDRLQAGQRQSRGGQDFIEASIIDARLREIIAERRRLIEDKELDPRQG